MEAIRKALVVTDDGSIFQSDVIEHEGSFWLVPEWLDVPGRGVTMPRRIVSMATVRYQRTPGAHREFVVNDPIPKAVLDGRAPSQEASKYDVRELPEIEFPLPKRMG
jgi:hypothetical protein